MNTPQEPLVPSLIQKALPREELTCQDETSVSVYVHFPGRVYWIEQPLVQAVIQTLQHCTCFWLLSLLLPSKDCGGQGAGQSDLLKFVPRS